VLSNNAVAAETEGIRSPRRGPRLGTLLRALFHGCDGLIECRALPSKARIFVTLDDLRALGTFLDDRQNENLYWAVATRKDASSGTLENCQHLPALFVDLDFKVIAEAEVWALLGAFPLRPSLVILSGGGLHVYWFLVEPFDLQVPAECDQARSLLRRLATYFNGDVASAEPAHVLRIPGSFNHKPDYPEPRRVVVQDFAPSVRFNPGDFDELLPTEREMQTAATPFVLPPQVRAGTRNTELFKYVRSLRKAKRKMSAAAILAATLAENRERCLPPLDDREVEAIVEHALELPDRPLLEVDQSPDVAPAEENTASASAASAPETVDPAPIGLLLEDTVTHLRRFVVMTEAQATAIALWVSHTHAFDASDATPYIHVTGATKRCGKTRLFEVIERLVRRPWRTARTTVAALARKIAGEKCTAMLDELDQVIKERSEYSAALVGILDAGHARGGTSTICVGDGHQVQELHVFSPKMLASIGALPDVIADRSIPIKLRRRVRSEPIERGRARLLQSAAAPLRAQWEAWAPAGTRALKEATPALPEELDDRAQDIWEPLLAIAESAGVAWAARARAAAVELSGSRTDDDVAVRLLSDMRDVLADTLVLDDRGPSFHVVSSSMLLKQLVALEESPWCTWSRGEEMTLHALSRLLAGFDLKSRQFRIADRRVRGYPAQAVEEVFQRYLPVQSVTV
jgi:Protein of unknown function (DUF3631)